MAADFDVFGLPISGGFGRSGGSHSIVLDSKVVAWKGAINCLETTFALAK